MNVCMHAYRRVRMYACVCMCMSARDGTIHNLKVLMHCPNNITMQQYNYCDTYID